MATRTQLSRMDNTELARWCDALERRITAKIVEATEADDDGNTTRAAELWREVEALEATQAEVRDELYARD